jgi:hypothetical protein
MKQIIRDFLVKYCTLSKSDETDEYVELMMDNHHFISFEDEQWYVPYVLPTSCNEDELLLLEFISKKYCAY